MTKKQVLKEYGMDIIYEDDTLKEGDNACLTPGKKIKSKGKGRGLARGTGNGPIGVPVGAKK